ncbi:hypothetical protein C8J57DRAFT_1671309 [Mycena rebaudengoi]|nr:hypothetical protein C8J57DRAFT_1671309 [Mycena rebaudengoi]
MSVADLVFLQFLPLVFHLLPISIWTPSKDGRESSVEPTVNRGSHSAENKNSNYDSRPTGWNLNSRPNLSTLWRVQRMLKSAALPPGFLLGTPRERGTVAPHGSSLCSISRSGVVREVADYAVVRRGKQELLTSDHFIFNGPTHSAFFSVLGSSASDVEVCGESGDLRNHRVPIGTTVGFRARRRRGNREPWLPTEVAQATP